MPGFDTGCEKSNRPVAMHRINTGCVWGYALASIDVYQGMYPRNRVIEPR